MAVWPAEKHWAKVSSMSKEQNILAEKCEEPVLQVLSMPCLAKETQSRCGHVTEFEESSKTKVSKFAG